MAITLGTPAASAGSQTTSKTLSFTVASGDERVLVVAVATDTDGTQTVTSLTFGGISLIKAIRAPGGATNKAAEIWYLPSPPVVTADIVATYSANNYNAFGAIVLYGCRQSIPVDNTKTSNGSGTISDAITTFASNCLIVDICAKDSDVAEDAGQTNQWAVSYIFNYMEGSTETATTPGSYTMSWTGSAGNYAHAVASFAPGQGGTGYKLPNEGLRPRPFAPGLAR